MCRFETVPPAQARRECAAYLEYLDSHEFYDPTADCVTLLTMHAAKGLEFPCVVVCGFEEGSIPLRRAADEKLSSKEQRLRLAEEKRLFYVAVTRAQEELYLLQAKKRQKKEQEDSSFWPALAAVETIARARDPAFVKRAAWKKKQYEKQLGLF